MTLPTLHGHNEVWQRLQEAIGGDRLPHALLFVGPAGIGKSLVARRLAASLACANSPAPCGSCDGCRQMAAGTHPDLLWIELPTGKKEIGIANARQLKRFVQLRAVTARRKIAVVDDADRLSIAAQNALLKSLEEPPGNATILLVTASPGTLLSTVRSRCQRVPFHPLTDADVRSVLETLVLEADANDEAEILRLVSEAEGSPGRALRLRDVWKTETRGHLLDLLADLRTTRYAPVVEMSKALGRSEPEMTARLEGLLEWYRMQAVATIRGRTDNESSISLIGAETAVQAADTIRDGLRMLRRRNPNRQLLAEALLLRLSRI